MGYTTNFSGSLILTPPATPEQVDYINKFSETRRMMRCPIKLREMFKGSFGLKGNYGKDGEYFIGGAGDFGQDRDNSVFDGGNEPPRTQPGLWCQWVLSEDGKELKWNEAEKFYSYGSWLDYLIEKFFTKWDIRLDGKIDWRGMNPADYGVIVVINNKVKPVFFEEGERNDNRYV